jgi:ribosomal protein L17
MQDIELPATILRDGLNAILTSEKLREFLALILRIGNFINGGTNRGGAYGFKFEFLDKVREIRTQQNGYLLVHHIVDNFPVDQLIAELECVKKCLTVDLDTSLKAYETLTSTFNRLANIMPEAEKLVIAGKGSRLFPQFVAFSEKNEKLLQAPREMFHDIEAKYHEILKSWGEEPEQLPLVELFGVFARLVDGLKKAVSDNEAARKAVREKLSQSQKAQRTGKQLWSGNNQRGVLDELVKTLQDQSPSPAIRGTAGPDINDLAAAFAKVRKQT